MESLINIEFFVCVGKWTISQQTLVSSIDVPLSPKINSFKIIGKIKNITSTVSKRVQNIVGAMAMYKIT